MSAVAFALPVSSPPSESLSETRDVLHRRMLETGYSPDDIAAVTSLY